MRVRPRWSARHSKTQYLLAAVVPALIITLSITGFVWASTEVTVVEDGQRHSIETQASDVGQVLDQAGIELGDADVVTPSRDTRLRRGMKIVVRHAVPIVLGLGGETLDLNVVGETVADALVAVGIDPAANTGVQPPITEPLTKGMSITVPDVFVRLVQEEAELKPGVRRQADASLEKGKTRVLAKGSPGKVLRVYRVIVAGGVESTRVLSVERVVQPAVQTVIAVGTARKPSFFAARARKKVTVPPAPKSGRSLQVVATGYSAAQPGLNDTTATGARARRGVVAVDPSVIPLGTRLYIPGYGYGVAADTGGAVSGTHIDLCFDTVAEALTWGRRDVIAIILPR